MGVFLHPLLPSHIDPINVTLSSGVVGRVNGFGDEMLFRPESVV
jgi:hypothetical protein